MKVIPHRTIHGELLWITFRRLALLLNTISLVLLMGAAVQAQGQKWAIALHGGAGNISRQLSEARLQEYKTSLQLALSAGEKVLAEGGTALDAVEQTVMVLEDSPCFNAGRGAVFNAAGYHQLDAAIMDGSQLACGSVAAVEHVRNPIRAARAVMEKTPHVMLTSQAADDFAAATQLEIVPQSYYFDQRRWDQFINLQKKTGQPVLAEPAYGLPVSYVPGSLEPAEQDISRGTVGCVALDVHGNLAAATSTGGLTGKMVGRVGDAPIIGGGTYCDNAGCAVSGTGNGEEYIRNAIAFQVNWRVRENKQPVTAAVQECLDKVLKPGAGGIIAVDRQGNLALSMNTESMSRGWADSSGKRGIALWATPLE